MPIDKNNSIKAIQIMAIFVYLVLSFITIAHFPFMHSDEGWLASLTRTITSEESIFAVEDFFHETDRHPHALKSLFHLIQSPFIYVRFSLFSVRLLSFIAGVITLYFFYQLALIFFQDRKFALLSTLVIAADIQFIYISHFARQEIIIFMVFVITLYVFFKKEPWSCRKDLFIGLILGVSIGIHPNIFIISCGITLLYIFQLIISFLKQDPGLPSFRNFALFITLLGFSAALYTGISLYLDSNFFHNYLSFGAQHGVTESFIIKLLKLPRFYMKMFLQTGGTYYLPDIRLQLILFGSSSIISIAAVIFFKKERILILSFMVLLLGINAGMTFIGKYSPPSIVFIFIPGYLLFFLLLKMTAGHKIYLWILLFFSSASLLFSAVQIFPWLKYDYYKYIRKIESTVPKDASTLANLNTVFAFLPEKLHAYRDLGSLDQNLGFTKYIEKYGIEYIIYSSELDIIYRERPVWNTMYGNVFPWYEDMISFLKNSCIKITSWEEPVFGMRITGYMKTRKGTITIYRVVNKKDSLRYNGEEPANISKQVLP